MAIVPNRAKVNIESYTTLNLSDTLAYNRDFNVVLANLLADSTLTLPNIINNRIVDGYFVWIKRKDKTTRIFRIAGNGNTINGLADFMLSATEDVCIIANVASQEWFFIKGNEYFITSSRNFALLTSAIQAAVVFNNNPTVLGGVGIYVSDGTNWLPATAGAVLTSGVITGIGTVGNPVRLINGPNRAVPIEFSELLTNHVVTSTLEPYIFVSPNGDNSNGDIYNAYRPFLTIDYVVSTYSDNISVSPTLYTIIVLPGSYTTSVNLTAKNLSYIFYPDTFITCSQTPFSWDDTLHALDSFSVYGSAQFVSNVDCITLLRNVSNVYFECQSIDATGSALTTKAASSTYKIKNITATNKGIDLQTGDGTIQIDKIVADIGILVEADTDWNVTVNQMNSSTYGCNILGSINLYITKLISTATGMLLQSGTTNINCDIMDTTLNSINMTGGNHNIITQTFVDNGTYSVVAVCSNVSDSMKLTTNNIVSVNLDTGNLGTINVKTVLLKNSVSLPLKITGGILNFNSDDANVNNLTLVSGGTANIFSKKITVTGYVLTQSNGTCNLKFEKCTTVGVIPFVISGGTTTLEGQILTGTAANIFSISNGNVTIDIDTVNGTNNILTASGTGANINFLCKNVSSTLNAFVISYAGASTTYIRNCYLNSLASAINYTNATASTMKVQNCVFVCVAHCITAAAAHNVIVYGDMVSNKVSDGTITFLVNAAPTVNALVS